MKNKRIMVYIGLGKKVIIECDDFEYFDESSALYFYNDKNEVIARFFDPLGYEIL